MGLRIQNNVEAFNAHRQLTGTAAKAAKSMEKLSSGYRINRAADDAAGLAISEKMRGQIGKIRSDTEFNGIKLLDGTGGTSGSISFQVGANAGESISVTTKDITASATSTGMSAL